MKLANLLRLALYDWSKAMPVRKRAGLLLAMGGLGMGIGLLWTKAGPAMSPRLIAVKILRLEETRRLREPITAFS